MENMEKKSKVINVKKRKRITFIVAVMIILIIIIISSATYFILSKRNTQEVVATLADEDVLNKISFSYRDTDTATDENAIGYLTIESIGLFQAPIAEGTDDSTLNKYIGHFSDSAYLEGNVCLAAHNRGYEKNYFENLKNIETGSLIIYQTKSEIKVYQVTEIKEINEKDVEVIENTKDNFMTLITCIENQETKRLCVVAQEI